MPIKEISMNYIKHYNLLIEKRKTNPINNEYTELHHIVPKCMGGTDEKNNLVRLTAREHYIAHALLYKHYRTSKLAHAWFSMTRCDPNQERFFTSRQHETAKKAHIKVLKESMIGENNPFFGKTQSEETKLAISEKVKTWYREVGKTKEQIQNWIDKVASKPASEKQKQTVSRLSKNKVMLKHIITGEVKKVDKKDLHLYNRQEWKNPSAIKQRRDICIYCGKESVAGNIKRWHNNNCKEKP